jgi:hypothetical protein
VHEHDRPGPESRCNAVAPPDRPKQPGHARFSQAGPGRGKDGVVLFEPLFVPKSTFISHVEKRTGRCGVGVAAADAFTCRCFPSPACLALRSWFALSGLWVASGARGRGCCVHVTGEGEAKDTRRR